MILNVHTLNCGTLRVQAGDGDLLMEIGSQIEQITGEKYCSFVYNNTWLEDTSKVSSCGLYGDECTVLYRCRWLIYVETEDNYKINLYAWQDATVKVVKELVEREHSIPVADQILKRKGVELSDQCTMEECGVDRYGSDSVLQLVNKQADVGHSPSTEESSYHGNTMPSYLHEPVYQPAQEYQPYIPSPTPEPSEPKRPPSSKQKSSTVSATSKQQEQSKETSTPQIFLSYQWDKQQQVESLYDKLTQEGYSCWMDIMIMGGGDSLNEQIEKGIRGCKVVISCVTSKYAQSANCRREVALSDALNKPIIPVLLDKGTSWPPEGPMGMVFSQLLYIRFSEKDQDSWTCRQFDQLLGQIKKHIPPKE